MSGVEWCLVGPFEDWIDVVDDGVRDQHAFLGRALADIERLLRGERMVENSCGASGF